jgi:hypothetical protein
MSIRARLFVLVPCAFAVLGARAAESRAQSAPPSTSMAGTWQAGATSMDVAVQSWGKDCGPRPQSTRSAGGGTVRITQQGRVITIHGSDRDLHSDRCFSPNPAMRKVSSSATNDQWVTRCKTPDDDPRKETGTYTLRALTPDKLQYQDVSHFDWKLNESTCVATITTSQTLSRVTSATRAEPSPSTATKAPQADAPAPCTPGAPAKLVLRPRRADLELGQRLCFQARLLDARDCAIEGLEPSWSLEHGPAIKARLERGCFRAGERSAESEGSFKVIATAAGLRAEAPVEVSAATLPALLAKRLETGAVQGDIDPEAEAEQTAAPAARVSSTSRVAAQAVVDQEPRRQRLLIGLAAVLAAAAAGVLLLRARPRTRRRSGSRASAEPSLAEPPPRASPDPPRARIRRCPTCGASYPEESAFCGADGSALAPPE